MNLADTGGSMKLVPAPWASTSLGYARYKSLDGNNAFFLI